MYDIFMCLCMSLILKCKRAIINFARLLGLFVFVVLSILTADLSVFTVSLIIISDFAESSLLSIMCLDLSDDPVAGKPFTFS